MNILKNLERRLRDRIEGAFARGGSAVQPVELAEWLAEEMDEQRMVGREKVYAPAEFTVYLADSDADSLAPYMETLGHEIAQFLFDHGQERGYALAHFPKIRFARRESLPAGEVDIETRLAEPTESSGTTEVFSAERLAEMRAQARPAYLETADGGRWELTGSLVRVGRLPANDVVLDDKNVSRHHCVLEAADGGWSVQDLRSTNGTKVNGTPVARTTLADGDELTLGTTLLVFRSG